MVPESQVLVEGAVLEMFSAMAKAETDRWTLPMTCSAAEVAVETASASEPSPDRFDHVTPLLH